MSIPTTKLNSSEGVKSSQPVQSLYTSTMQYTFSSACKKKETTKSGGYSEHTVVLKCVHNNIPHLPKKIASVRRIISLTLWKFNWVGDNFQS